MSVRDDPRWAPHESAKILREIAHLQRAAVSVRAASQELALAFRELDAVITAGIAVEKARGRVPQGRESGYVQPALIWQAGGRFQRNEGGAELGNKDG